jgi:hypothetical protein
MKAFIAAAILAALLTAVMSDGDPAISFEPGPGGGLVATTSHPATTS